MELWRQILRSKYFKFCRIKIECMRCEFSNIKSEDEDIKLDRQILYLRRTYLELILESDDEINKNINHK
jgi:hypothetical protein